MLELIWDGKYWETPQGRQKAGPVRIALPFQTIETVNESAAKLAGRLKKGGNPLRWQQCAN